MKANQKNQSSPLAKELKKIRIDHDHTRAEMAAAIGIAEKTLANIELGKEQASDALLLKVVTTYGGEPELVLTLRAANAESTTSVTFDMTQLDSNQKIKVMELKSVIDFANAEKQKAAQEEAEKIKAEKAQARKAAREAKKAQPVDAGGDASIEEPTATPVETQVAPIEAAGAYSSEEINEDDLESLLEGLEA